jgi:L-amino acid N-acyltransferase YncA
MTISVSKSSLQLPSINIRLCEMQDIQAICDIYNYYIENTVATFEEQVVNYKDMQQRILSYMENYVCYVAEINKEVVAYAYANEWKQRSAYKHTAETTVYTKHTHLGKSYGKALYAVLLAELAILTKKNIHNVLACIALPHPASIQLHEFYGFQKVAHFNSVGKKFNRWIDVGYWQKNLKV